MKLSLIFCLLPILIFAQHTEGLIKNAEQELQNVKAQEEKIISKIEELKFKKIHEDLEKIGLPKLLPGEEVIYHSAYALTYAEPYEQAKWVAHIILPDVMQGNEGRSNDFRADTSIKTGSAVDADYFKKDMQPNGTIKYESFGYDRGHLAPSADFRYSKKALSESYYYSNMSPQVAQLNRGRWAEMEDMIRQYVVKNKTQLYVVTGGILKPELKKIEQGRNKVSIPEQYFKVVLDMEHQQAIGFIMPNQDCKQTVMHYACTIDSVESVTGIDFFPNLLQSQQDMLERNYNIEKWLSQTLEGNVTPLRADSLPRNTFNTEQAQLFMGKDQVVKVCGTVVSTKLSSKGNIFLNLDKKFPNQSFTVTIFKNDVVNFSYMPNSFLSGKSICVTGKVTNFNGVPNMNIENEKAIEILE